MQHPIRPNKLTHSYIPSITGATGKHTGSFQLVEFHLKKHNIYSCHISDGYFHLKVIFLDVAGNMIADGRIKLLSVVFGDVYNYSFEEGVYLVKDVMATWDYGNVIGEPKDWRPRRVNQNSRGNNKIQWEDQLEPMGYAFSFKEEEKKQEKKQTEKQQPEFVVGSTESLPVQTAQIKRTSNIELPNLEEQQVEILPQFEKHSPGVQQQASQLSQPIFSEQDFAQLQLILGDHKKTRESSKKKMRVSTSSENLNDLLQTLELFDVQRLPIVQIQKEQTNEPIDEIPQIPILPSQMFEVEVAANDSNNNLGLEDISDLLKAIEDNHSHTEILQDKVSSGRTQQISPQFKPQNADNQEADLLDLPDLDVLYNLDSINKSEVPKSKRKTYKIEIAELCPELSGWFLHAKVLAKGSICRRYFKDKKFSNFVCILKDIKNNGIEAMFVDESLYEKVQEDQFYEFMNGQVKSSRNKVNKSSNSTLQFDRNTIITPAQIFSCDGNSIYTSVSQVHQLPPQTFVHTIAIIKKCDAIKYMKEGESKMRTSCLLVDPISCSEIQLMDFGGLNLHLFKPLTIVTIYNAKISKYRQLKGLVAWSSTIVKQGCEHTLTLKQLQEFQNQEMLDKISFKYTFPKRTLGELKQLQNLLMENQNEPIDLSSQIQGSFVSFFKKSIYYLSCPECRKKLISQPNNRYSCPRCKCYKEPIPRFFIGGQFASSDGSIFASLEQKLAQRIIGMSPTDLWHLQKQGNRKKIQQAYCDLVSLEGRNLLIQVTGWVGVTNNAKRASYTIRDFTVPDFPETSSSLLTSISNYLDFI